MGPIHEQMCTSWHDREQEDPQPVASFHSTERPVGVGRFGTKYRRRNAAGDLDGATLPIDLAANAASFGVTVLRAKSMADLHQALIDARANTETTVIHVEDDPLVPSPDSGSWWDVPVAETAELEATRAALVRYQSERIVQRDYFRQTTLSN